MRLNEKSVLAAAALLVWACSDAGKPALEAGDGSLTPDPAAAGAIGAPPAAAGMSAAAGSGVAGMMSAEEMAGAGGSGGASGSAGAAGMSGAAEVAGAGGEAAAGAANAGAGGQGDEMEEVVERLDGVDDKFSFFVMSYFHIKELSGKNEGFGGDLRYNGAATGLEGADAICQEAAKRVGFGNRTWKAFLSTSTVDAKDRIGSGPWYDFVGNLVATDLAGLLVPRSCNGLENGNTCSPQPTPEMGRPAGGALDNGSYDELGQFHDGSLDQNNDNIGDDDHDTMTATLADGTYAGFSCDDWTSTTAEVPGGAVFPGGGILMGHSWAAGSGIHWTESHAGHGCAAGTNFIQDGAGDAATVGGGGGYGGFYCFALAE